MCLFHLKYSIVNTHKPKKVLKILESKYILNKVYLKQNLKLRLSINILST